MKKKVLMMLTVVLPMAAVMGYSVRTINPNFYFEDKELKNRNTDGASWLQGNTIYNKNNPDYEVTPSKQGSFYIVIEKPGVAVKCWLTSKVQGIANATELPSSNTTDLLYDYDPTYSDVSEVYLYVWLKWMRYDLRFSSNGGSDVSGSEGDDVCYTNSIPLPTPTRTGYDFDGWTNSTITTGLKDTKTGADFGVTEDGETISLYGKWTAKTYTVTFDANGEGATVLLPSKDVTYHSPYGELPTPTRADYEFEGWWTKKTGGSRIEPDTKVTTAEAHTLYAHWEKLPVVTFHYGLNGISVVSNTTATAPDPSVPGYTFKGWEPAVFSPVISNMDVRAVYSPNRYTVSYDVNGGSGSMTNDVFTYDVEYSLQSNAFERSMYKLVGWASKPDASTNEVEYTDRAMVSNLTTEANATYTLYAVWRSLLTDYSIAADCTNLILECTNVVKRWGIDNEDGFASTSSVYAVGSDQREMTTTLSGMGTLVFRAKCHMDSSGTIVFVYGGKMGLADPNIVKIGEEAEGNWIVYSYSPTDSSGFDVTWSYMGFSADDKCWIDQVNWYPERTVGFPYATLNEYDKNKIRESILQHWELLLGDSASSVSSITARGNSLSNAVEIIEYIAQGWKYSDKGVTIAVDGMDPSKATLECVDVLLPTMITNAQVTVDPVSFVYDGSAHEPANVLMTVDGSNLVAGVDYEMVCSNNVNAGEATLTFCGINGYFGTYTTNFTIAAKSITNSSVTVESPIVYTGSAICPLPTVTDEERGVPLVKDSDYTLTWANNVDVGEADVTVTGMGNYKDAMTAHFTIKSKAEADLEQAFAGLPAVVESDGAGGWKVSFTDDITDATIEVPDDLGNVTLDLCGHTFTGAAGQSPIRLVKGNGAGTATKLSLASSSAAAAVTGGAGASAISVDDGVQNGVAIVVGTGITVQGGGANVPAVEGAASVSVDGGGSIVKATYDMSGARWDYAGEFAYDGNPKTVLVTGLPTGVTASYTGNTATDPGTYTAHVTFAYDEERYNAPVQMEDLVWTIKEPDQPVEPVISGTLNVAFARAQTVMGVLRDASGNVAGVVQVKAGKINMKRAVKISASITMMGGKKLNSKSVSMLLNRDGTMSNALVFKAPVGAMPFSMAADGSFLLANATYGMQAEKVGEKLPNGARTFTVAMDPSPDLDAGFEFIWPTIPNGVAIIISNGKKLDAGKSATIKYEKIKENNAVRYDLVGLDNAKKPNLSSLKLTYATQTGIFKGSFKVYATNSATLAQGVKPKLKTYSVNVWGLMIGAGDDFAGVGEASCKKLTAGSWRVEIK